MKTHFKLKIIDFIFIVCDEFESFNSAISILKRVPSYNFEKSKNPYKDKMELRIQKLLVGFYWFVNNLKVFTPVCDINLYI